MYAWAAIPDVSGTKSQSRFSLRSNTDVTRNHFHAALMFLCEVEIGVKAQASLVRDRCGKAASCCLF